MPANQFYRQGFKCQRNSDEASNDPPDGVSKLVLPGLRSTDTGATTKDADTCEYQHSNKGKAHTDRRGHKSSTGVEFDKNKCEHRWNSVA